MKKTLLAVWLLTALGGPAATAQVADPTFGPHSMYTPATVYSAVQQGNGQRLICGTFTRIDGMAVNSLARFDASGALDQNFARNVGAANYVFKVRLLPNGQYLLLASNDTIMAGGLTRQNLLRLNADGTADATFTMGAGATIAGGGAYINEAQVLPDGKIMAAGYFDAINGTPAHNIVRLNSNGTVDASFQTGAGFDGDVFGVTVQPNGALLVSGNFTTFDGRPCPGVARLNASGSFDPSFATPLQDYSVANHVTVQPDGKLLVEGTIRVGNVSRGLVRLNANGTLDTNFSAAGLPGNSIGFFYYDRAIQLQPDGKILVAGSFTQASGGPGNNVARLNADGSPDASFQAGSGTNTRPLFLTLQADGTALVGGQFYTFGTRDDTPLVQLTSTGALDTRFLPKVQRPGSVSKIVPQADGKLLVSGNFTELNGQRVHRLARLSADGVPEANFTANVGALPSPTNVLVQPDGKILVSTQNTVLRFNATGTPDNSFAPASFTGGNINTSPILQPDGRILVGGTFTAVNGTSASSSLVRLQTDGTLDASFVAQPQPVGSLQIAYAILVQADGKVLVGGAYLNGRMYLVRYLSTGSVDATFAPILCTAVGASPVVYALTQQPDGKLLVGGRFNKLGTTTQANLARVMDNGTIDPTFTQGTPLAGTVRRIIIQPNGHLLVSGLFQGAPLPGSTNLLRFLPDGQPDTSFGATAKTDGTVVTLFVQADGKIVIGGSFTTVGSQASIGVARLTASNVLHVTAAAAEARTQAWPVPAHETLYLSLDDAAQPQTVELLDNLGRVVVRQTATQAESRLNLRRVKSGVYLLRVNYAAGPVVRRVVVE